MSDSDSPTPTAPQVKAGAILAFVVFILLLPGVLYLAAGTFRWPAAWLYHGLTAGGALLSRGVVALVHRDLLAERGQSRRAKDAKPYERLLLPLVGVVGPLAILIVCGLDKRWSWTPPLPGWVTPVAAAVFIAGYAFATWAMATNRFFSAVMRIQRERGHQVATGGPYRIVRHPGYAGGTLAFAAIPFILGTLWGLAAVAGHAAAVVVRTALEDRALQAELPGYREYAERTRYRLLPGVW